MGKEGRALRAAAASAGVRDPRVLAAVEAVERSQFVPTALRGQATVDAALPIPDDQTTSQPSLIALMVEALALTSSSRVLEIGTGLGYEAAVLSHLCAEVVTVEIHPGLAADASRRLAAHGATNVRVLVGDGRSGAGDFAPFDAVVVAAQTESVAPAWVAQLAEGGLIVVPLGDRSVQRCVVLERRDGVARERADLGLVRFVPLTGSRPDAG